jgi:hypothetical protein
VPLVTAHPQRLAVKLQVDILCGLRVWAIQHRQHVVL